MRVLITGAHFTPAVAVIEQLKKFKGVELAYVGRKTTLEGDRSPSVESQILPAMGVKFIPLITGRLQRAFTIHTIPSLLKIPIGILQAIWILMSQRPDVILSFGGYVAVPTVIAGWFFSVPIIIHEQTLVSGLANKIGSLFADKIAVSFESKTDGDKFILTGNPIRSEVINVRSSQKRGSLPVVLITGGNQGSHAINLAVEECLSKLIKTVRVIHVTGDSKYMDFERLSIFKSKNYEVKKWIGSQWGNLISQVDLVVSRAGINTLSELAYIGKPALVIPVPYLYQDEQNKNAAFFEKLGLVRVLPQSRLTGESLFTNILSMMKNLKGLTEQAKRAKKAIIPEAAKRLALETMLLVKREAAI